MNHYEQYLLKLYWYRICCFLVCCALSSHTIAQSDLKEDTPTKIKRRNIPQMTIPVFKRVDKEVGLPKYLGKIKRDSIGYIWISSSEGIYRFDGVYAKKIELDASYSTSLLEKEVANLYIDRLGLPWVITFEGNLYRYDPDFGKFNHLPLVLESGDSTIFVKVKDWLSDNQGQIWIGTQRNGINRLDPKTGKLFPITIKDPITQEIATTISLLREDHQGNIWGVGKHLFCLALPKDPQISFYPEVDSIVGIITYIAVGKNNAIWIGGNRQEIAQLNPLTGVLQPFIYENNFKKSDFDILDIKVKMIMESVTGSIITTNGFHGVHLLNPLTREAVSLRYNRYNPKGISDNNIMDVVELGFGRSWLTSWGGGLNCFNADKANFGHFPSFQAVANTISNSKVFSFCEETADIIWIGTQDGLNRFDRRAVKFKRYYPFRRLNTIYSIARGDTAQSDHLWVGTEYGLQRFNSTSAEFLKWQATETTKYLETDEVIDLEKDANGTLWVISRTPYRISKFEVAEKVFKEIKLTKEDNRLIDYDKVIADKQGNFWIVSKENDLFKFDLTTQELTHFDVFPNESAVFIPKSITCVTHDEQNRPWIGTDNGLYLLLADEKKENTFSFKRFYGVKGLPKSTIAGILNDKQGNLWISTLREGLSKLDTKTFTFQNYGEHDGLQGNDFITRAYFRSPFSDELYVGGNNGFNLFDPKDIKNDSIIPPVVITEVDVLRNSELQEIFPKGSADKEPINTITLFHGDKLLNIKYAALHYAAPALNQYAIQLEGYDHGWRQVGNQHEVTYTNLNAGTYLFRVKASNKNGVWNEVGTAMKIIVYPPWWATSWAYLIYSCSLIGGLYYLFRFHEKRIQEKAEALHYKEMDALKSRFFANISHELRTPLTLMLGPINSAIKRNKLDNRDFTFMMMARQSGQQLLQLVNSILDFSRMEVGKLNLLERGVALYPLMQRLLAQFESNAEIQEIEMNVDYQADQDLTILLDVLKFEIIVNNLLSNALKFTNQGGKIEVQIINKNNQLRLKVADTGRGIHPDDLPHIFDRFYQTKQANFQTEGGSGIGLAVSREYADLFQGELRVESQLGIGSTFYFVFPLKLANHTPFLSTEEVALEAVTSSSKTRNVNQKEPTQHRPRILLVEDNSSLREYIQLILGDYYQISTAENGQVALDFLNEQSTTGNAELATKTPQLILSDIMMPIMDGFQLLEELKTNKKWRGIPVIILTARAALRDKLKALRIGVDDYLIKPFDEAELIARIDNLLENYHVRQIAINSPTKIEDAPSVTIKPEWLETLEQILEKHVADSTFSIDSLPTQLAMSRSQFFRTMKEQTGLTPNQYLREIRLQKARCLIETMPKTNVKVISNAVGFQKVAYFSELFKNRFGKTPLEYMENY